MYLRAFHNHAWPLVFRHMIKMQNTRLTCQALEKDEGSLWDSFQFCAGMITQVRKPIGLIFEGKKIIFFANKRVTFANKTRNFHDPETGDCDSAFLYHR